MIVYFKSSVISSSSSLTGTGTSLLQNLQKISNTQDWEQKAQDHQSLVAKAALVVEANLVVEATLVVKAALVVEANLVDEAVLVVQVGLVVTAGLAIWAGPYPSWEEFLQTLVSFKQVMLMLLIAK